MGDLDVLVDPRHFRAAHQVLVEDGFEFEFRSPFESAEIDEAELGGGSEYWKKLPSGEKLWFELQWRPVAGRWIRPDQEPKASELVERSVAIEGSVVRMLAPRRQFAPSRFAHGEAYLRPSPRFSATHRRRSHCPPARCELGPICSNDEEHQRLKRRSSFRWQFLKPFSKRPYQTKFLAPFDRVRPR